MTHKAGYWDVPWTMDAEGNLVGRSRFDVLFIECPFPGSCLENGCMNTTGGPLCAVCIHGTFREFPMTQYVVCKEDTTSSRIIIALSIIVSFCIGFSLRH